MTAYAAASNAADLLVHYELQTDTLIIRVLEPLDQRSTHAVVLTKRSGRPRASWARLSG